VPTVGVNTIRMLHAAGGRCLAIAAGDVIMLEKAEMIRLADKLGVSIVGVEPARADDADHAPIAEIKGRLAVSR